MTIVENFRKEVLAASAKIAKGIEEQYPNFKLQFIVFRRGQRQDECEKILSKLSGHPCEQSANQLLKSIASSPENSTFVGLATGLEKTLLGMRKTIHFMGFVTINIDAYSKAEDCLFDLYHNTTQVMDTYELAKERKQNSLHSTAILQPKRNLLSLSRNNLKSDVFSSLAMFVNGKKSAVSDLAISRAKRTLTAQIHYRPEDYPFIISTDVTNYTIKNLVNEKTSDLVSLFKLSDKIALSFDKHNLRSWIDFAVPAQTMAWNGFTEEQILGTAIQTSSDPFIKATANLICEITKIQPEIPTVVPNASNPYIDLAANSANHAKLTEETFELALSHAIEAESHLPLIDSANDQNEALLKGRMLGWCADALQSAAKTFEQTSKKGQPPAPASRIEFQRLTANTNWESLDNLNTAIIAQRREGHAMTFTDIANTYGNRPELKHVMESIKMTMSDPAYQARLDYANEAPRPNMNFVKAPTVAPQVPMPSYAPAMALGSGMGMSSGGGMMNSPPPKQPQQTSKIVLSEDDET